MNRPASYFQKLPRQPRAILQILVYGLAGGLAAVAFQLAMNKLFQATYHRLAGQSHARFLLGSFFLIVGTSLLVGFLLTKFAPTASGSGIPQLKLAFWKDFGAVPWRVSWVKFVAGILSIGGGSSLGREGPSVQIAGGLASNLAAVMGEAKQSRRVACSAGAAAGLAAAFNTPLAAVTFVLEEIIQDLNSPLLGSVLLAALIGAFITHGFIGKQPAFAMSAVEPSSWQVYSLVPLVAAASSLIGFVFQKVSLHLRSQRRLSPLIPPFCRPVLGAIITWLLGSAVFLRTGSLGVFGLGYDDLSRALTESFPWQLAALLLVTKLIFESAELYYSTLFHELTHSTGHVSRLNRKGIAEQHQFGSDPYSREELVAEMGAAFLCGHSGIENKTINQSSGYIQHWLDRLKEDRKLIIQAGSQAQKACDFILDAKAFGDEGPKENQPKEFKVVALRECPTPESMLVCETPDNAAEYWKMHIATSRYFNPECECFVVLLLNSRRKVKGHHLVSIGTLDTILVHPREVFRIAVMHSASAVVIMHNHPSGEPAPSEADIKVTRDLIRAGQLLKIEVLDHVIIGTPHRSSLRELGYFYS